jgi:Acyl-CoA dehydrogenase, middle domain/Acyl-CoA dehydrogenase, N-terminal domain
MVMIFKSHISKILMSSLFLKKVDPSVAALVDIHNTLVINLFSRLGTQAQKEKYLTKLCTEFPGSFALSEPSSGSDAFALKTTAKKVGSNYILNGTKMWISNSDLSGVFIIMANADPSQGYKGITAFIVERDQEGFVVGKKENKLGICASGTCMLHLDNVIVPEENILGELGKGYAYSASILNEGRIGIGAYGKKRFIIKTLPNNDFCFVIFQLLKWLDVLKALSMQQFLIFSKESNLVMIFSAFKVCNIKLLKWPQKLKPLV